MRTPSETIWRHLPLLFQKGMLPFGLSSSNEDMLIDQVTSSSSSSLRLDSGAAVDGDTVNMETLSAALQQNTTLQHVTICGSFLQNLENTDAVYALFRAIGGLPNLTQLTLQGSEDSDAFPVEALTLLLETSRHLQELSCQYVDFLVSKPSALSDLGLALEECKSLDRVTLASLGVLAANRSACTSLDPVVSSLGRCREVEIGLRSRQQDCGVSPKALRSLLLHPSGNLQKLSLKRRLNLDAHHLMVVLQSLSGSSSLKELQLDEISLPQNVDATTISALWQEALPAMLQSNSTLEVLDLSFGTTAVSRMDHKAVLAVTEALKTNSTLRHLCLLGALGENDARAWLELLEFHNFTLQELQLFPPFSSVVEEDSHYYDREKLQFFLRLNQQALSLGNEDRQCCGTLRTILLKDYNGAIPQNLVGPCVEAALRVGRDAEEADKSSMADDASIGDVFDDDDGSFWDTAELQTIAGSTEDDLGLSGLFYLLQQQPSLVASIQQQMEIHEEHAKVVEASRLKKKRKAEQEEATRSCILLGGGSLELPLLSEDYDSIVGLWELASESVLAV